MTKSEAYRELVKESQDSYRDNVDGKCDGKIKLLPPDLDIFAVDGKLVEKDPGICFCNEINLYTYWQGVGYEENTPAIKYLLVGQDWGNPFNVASPFFERILRITNGETNVRYLLGKDDPDAFETDRNLTELFKVLGYGAKREVTNITVFRYPELFFTNFCLGYRSGKDSSGMTVTQMMKDSEYFLRLCAILQPENILCLGKNTFQCVYATLSGDASEKLPADFYNDYNRFLDRHEPITLRYSYSGYDFGTCESVIYPLAHCGAMGTMNRNKGYGDDSSTNAEDKLKRQMEDWTKIRNREKGKIMSDADKMTRAELVKKIEWYAKYAGADYPEGYPDKTTDEEMRQWIMTWDDFDPFPELD